MSDLHHHFTNIKNELSLTSEERASMRAYLTSQMHTPLPPVPVASPYAYVTFFMQPARMVALLLLVAIAGGSTTTLAAEDALPGDTLYRVKVQVNERFESTLAFSALQKADVEIRHAEERLREIQLLAATEKDEDIVLAVEDAQVYLSAAKNRIATLSERNPALKESESELAFALSANADIIEAQALERTDDVGTSLVSLARMARGDSEDTVSENGERAKKIIDKARERVVSRELPHDTREALLGELALVEGELLRAQMFGSLKGFALAERHAYRVLAVADSARRINDKTGKDIAISFITEDEEESHTPVATTRANEYTEDAAATMMMAVPQDDTVDEVREKRDEEDEDTDDRTLRFRISDDSDDDEDKEEDTDEENRDSSGKGSSEALEDGRT